MEIVCIGILLVFVLLLTPCIAAVFYKEGYNQGVKTMKKIDDEIIDELREKYNLKSED